MFIDQIKSSGFFHDLIEAKYKGGALNIGDRDFVDICSLKGYGYRKLDPRDTDQFFLDGRFGFALFDNINTVGMCISFDHPDACRIALSCNTPLENYLRDNYSRLRTSYKNKDILCLN